MRFNWKTFFQQRRIEYVTSGPNTKKGNVSIRCPYCGDGDPSQHLGIDLKTGFWGCFRNATHRGRSPVRLVRQLLHCSQEEAQRIVGIAADLAPTTDALAESFKGLRAQVIGEETQTAKDLRLPGEFKPLLNGSPLAQPFIDYLKGRGFRDAQIKWLAQHYSLHYATKGLYAYCIVIPVYDRYGELMTWTARSISPNAKLRYRTLSTRSDQAGASVARIPINGTILGLPLLWSAENAKILILVEGPFDALKLTAFGQTLGVYAAALFGLNVYPTQVAEVQDIASKFERAFLLLDDDAKFQRLRLLDTLNSIGAAALSVPFGRKDPGDLTGAEVIEFCLSILSKDNSVDNYVGN